MKNENENISLDDIGAASDLDLTPSDQNNKARSEWAMLKELAHNERNFRNELGWLGRTFGGRREKSGNISGLVICACFVFLIVAYFHPHKEEMGISFERIFSGLLSVVTLILGYLFGSNDRY